MKNIAMHILDIAQNSIRAEANKIVIALQEKTSEKTFSFEIKDNGCGIPPEMLKNIADPYVTTRKTRNKGLGLALLKQNVETCKGKFFIDSQLTKGTELKALFQKDHIDCPPLGNIVDVLVQLMVTNEKIQWIFYFKKNKKIYTLDSKEIEKSLDGVSMNNPEIIKFLKSMINENLYTIDMMTKS